MARSAPHVVVDRDGWLPWTPRQEQATYALALSCSNGQSIGQFREAYEPPAGTQLPAGSVGQVGPTNVACDDWPLLYRARRRGTPA